MEPATIRSTTFTRGSLVAASYAEEAPAERDRVAGRVQRDSGAAQGRRCGGDGLKDQLRRGLRLRREGDVRSRHLDDRRVRALGHEPLELRRDGLVLGAEQIPGGQCLPG